MLSKEDKMPETQTLQVIFTGVLALFTIVLSIATIVYAWSTHKLALISKLETLNTIYKIVHDPETGQPKKEQFEFDAQFIKDVDKEIKNMQRILILLYAFLQSYSEALHFFCKINFYPSTHRPRQSLTTLAVRTQYGTTS